MDNSETHVTLATRYRKDNNLKKKKKCKNKNPATQLVVNPGAREQTLSMILVIRSLLMKRQLKQWLSMPPISSKRTIISHLNSSYIKNDHYIWRCHHTIKTVPTFNHIIVKHPLHSYWLLYSHGFVQTYEKLIVLPPTFPLKIFSIDAELQIIFKSKG